MKIFLVGMPGCGKSTVGQLLAQKLNCSFLDLDTLVEEQEGQTVAQVFEQKGQDYFRAAEAKALRRVAELPKPVVLATGGGAACFHGNMAYMQAQGTSVYLQLTVAELLQRLLQQNLHARPLLRGKSEAELTAYLRQTLAQREPFYAQASFTLAVGQLSAEATAQALQQRLTFD